MYVMYKYESVQSTCTCTCTCTSMYIPVPFVFVYPATRCDFRFFIYSVTLYIIKPDWLKFKK